MLSFYDTRMRKFGYFFIKVTVLATSRRDFIQSIGQTLAGMRIGAINLAIAALASTCLGMSAVTTHAQTSARPNNPTATLPSETDRRISTFNEAHMSWLPTAVPRVINSLYSCLELMVNRKSDSRSLRLGRK